MIIKEGGQCGQLIRCEHFWTFWVGSERQIY